MAPQSVSEVVAVLSEHGDRAKLLAGGTDIIVQLREGLREADMVVDIKKIDAVTSFKYCDENGLSLGSAVACYNLYEHPQLSKLYGALADSTHIIGGWQIQSRASVGGNLCNASPAADSIPALIALNATAVIAGPSGERSERFNMRLAKGPDGTKGFSREYQESRGKVFPEIVEEEPPVAEGGEKLEEPAAAPGEEDGAQLNIAAAPFIPASLKG